MMDLLSSFVLFFSVLVLTLIEKKYVNNLFTPFTVTAWPFATISLMVNLIAVRLEFLPVTARANYFILLNLFIIWLVGFLMFHTQRKPLEKQDYMEVFCKYREFRYFLLILSWIVIIAVFLKISSILGKEGLAYIGTDEFEKKMIQGPVAHLTVFGQALLILYLLILWNSKKRLVDYITIILLGVSVISLMVRYHIIWVVLIVFFIKNINLSPGPQIRKITTIASFVVVFFVAYYAVFFLSWGSFSFSGGTMWTLILGWLFNYLMSGPIMLDRWIDLALSKPWWSIFTVPINFYNTVFGNPERLDAVNYVSPGFAHVSPKFVSNVGTSYGVYYLIGGFAFTMFVSILISVISYYLYFKSRESANPVIIFLTATVLTLATLSFFVQYFTVLSLYEMTVFYLLLIGIFQLIQRLKAA